MPSEAPSVGQKFAVYHPDCTQQDVEVVQRVIRSTAMQWSLVITSVGVVALMVGCTSGLSVLEKSGLWGLAAASLSLLWYRLVWWPRRTAEYLEAAGKLLWLTGKVREAYQQLVAALTPRLPEADRHEVQLQLFQHLREAQQNQGWMDRGQRLGFTETDGYSRLAGARDFALGQIEELARRYPEPS